MIGLVSIMMMVSGVGGRHSHVIRPPSCANRACLATMVRHM